MRKTYLLAFAFLVAAILSACGRVQPPEETFSHGVVSLFEFNDDAGSFVDGGGSFRELQAAPGQGNPFAALVGTCYVEASTGDGPLLPLPNIGGAYRDVGASLAVTANGEPYMTLARQTTGAIINYTGSAAGPLPDGPLGIAIPSTTAFPATTGTFPSVADLELDDLDTGTGIIPTTNFTWTGDSNGVIVLIGEGENAQGQTVVFGCVTADDGDFEFPEATQAQLTDDFEGNLTLAGRVAYATTQQGDDAALTLMTARFATYGDVGFVPAEALTLAITSLAVDGNSALFLQALSTLR